MTEVRSHLTRHERHSVVDDDKCRMKVVSDCGCDMKMLQRESENEKLERKR
jgi:hypothetical protein